MSTKGQSLPLEHVIHYLALGKWQAVSRANAFLLLERGGYEVQVHRMGRLNPWRAMRPTHKHQAYDVYRARREPGHDYPACGIFRGGKCSCDAAGVAQSAKPD